MKINVHAGHNSIVPGAVSILNEVTEDRKVKNKVIELLRNAGHTVYDCTDDVAKTKSQNLANIVSKCNAHAVDLDVSIHLNSARNDLVGDGKTGGVEVWVYSNASKAKAFADKICEKVSSQLGMTNRGTKYCGKSLYVIRKTNSPALLVECCFVDDRDDANKWNADACAKAIVEGITDQVASVQPTQTKPTSQPSTPKPAGKATGTYEVTASDLSVRTGPGTGYRRKRHDELTEDGKKHDKDKDGCLERGTRVTVYEWQNGWARTPSGWVSGDYLKKV